MNKKVLLGAIAAVVVIGGGAYFAMNQDKESETNSNNSQTQNSNSNDSAFNPKSTEGMSYVATMTGTGNGQTFTSTMEYDGKGNSKYIGNFGGFTIETYDVGGYYYTCQAGTTCVRYSNPQNEDNNSAQISFTDEELAGFRNGATFKGKQDCSVGSCDAWQLVEAGGITSTVLVASDGRIVKAVGTGPEGTTYEISYDYKDVTVTAPTEYRSL